MAMRLANDHTANSAIIHGPSNWNCVSEDRAGLQDDNAQPLLIVLRGSPLSDGERMMNSSILGGSCITSHAPRETYVHNPVLDQALFASLGISATHPELDQNPI